MVAASLLVLTSMFETWCQPTAQENMILDGDFFDSGSWCGAKVASLETGKVSRLEFASDEVFRGLTGLMWFVSEKSLDTYFSRLESSQYGFGYLDTFSMCMYIYRERYI